MNDTATNAERVMILRHGSRAHRRGTAETDTRRFVAA
jgi:hypothetical protein